MPKLDLKLVDTLKLTKLDSPQAVRRKNNSYALNETGRLSAVSFSEQEISELSLEEDAMDLEHLYLAGNRELSRLTFNGTFSKLKHLYLNNCGLRQLKVPKGFSALKQLYLQKNQLELLEFVGACSALVLLDLSENQLQELILPEGFVSLKFLFLRYNRLAEIQFRRIPQLLDTLDVRENQLKSLPANFHTLSQLKTLYLAKNPEINIPTDLIGSGDNNNAAESVLSYLRSMASTRQTRYLHEAKMILVGNPEVGKSSIRVRLQDPNAALPKPEDRTPGLEVEPFYLNNLGPEITHLTHPINFQLNIWDFGGQGRYREIQQLFCSRKSLYLYVTAPDDKPEDKKENYVGVEYWLSMVNAYSHDADENKPSPVIYVQNKMDLDEWEPKKENTELFKNLVKYVRISALKCQNLDQLTKSIVEVLPQVSRDVFLDQYSEDWFRVKDHLEQLPDHYLSYADYLMVCKKNRLDEAQAKAWIQTLDRIGTVIYFGDKHELGNWIILKPSWVKDAICKVIDHKSVQEEGMLKALNFDDIWAKYPQDEERQNLLKIMEAFKLAFPIAYKGKPAHIVPAALFGQPKPDLADAPHLEKTPDYRLQLTFTPFIPAGIVNKIMVSLYKNIYKLLIWGNGGILHDPTSNTYAELNEVWEEKRIYVSLFGAEPGTFYGTIIGVLNGILQEMEAAKPLLELNFTEELFMDELWFEKGYLIKQGKYPFSQDHLHFEKHQQIKNMDEIRNLIANARVEEAIKKMNAIAPQKFKNDITQQSEKYQNLRRDEMKGILTNEAKEITRAQIVNALLELLTQWKQYEEQGEKSDGTSHEPLKVQGKIYFSYAWGDPEEKGASREELVNALYDSLHADGFNVLRDKMDLDYGGLISEFMKQLGEGDQIVVFISDKYVRSPYCMFELFEIARNNRWDKAAFAKRILPVAIERLRFDDPDVLEVYFGHWEAEEAKWAKLIQRRMDQISDAQYNRYQKIKEINQNFSKLSDWLTDMNSKTNTILREDDFAEVKSAILKRLKD